MPGIAVILPVSEIKPVIKSWLKDNYVWSEEIESRCFIPQGRKNPCLALEDELEIQDILQTKIAADTEKEVIQSFLLDLLFRGSLPIPTMVYVDHLETMGLIRKTERRVYAEPLLSTWPVPHLLGIS